MKITLFGLAGTGTSSAGREVASRLNVEFVSTGNLFRARAKELGISINQLDLLAQTDISYDKALDDKIVAYGQTHDNFIVESRLAWHFIPDSIKIKFDCEFPIRIGRVASRDKITLKEAEALTVEREQAIFERYARYYGIDDCQADNHFDLVINTSTVPLNQAVQTIIDFVTRAR